MTHTPERYAADWWARVFAKEANASVTEDEAIELALTLWKTDRGFEIVKAWALERGREARRLHLAKHRTESVTPATIRLTAADVVSVIEEVPPARESWVWTDPAGRDIDLLKLNRTEAITLIRSCERAGVQNFKLAGILKLAASRLTGDERIGDRVTVAELEHFESHIDVAYPLPDLRSIPPWNPDSPPSQAHSTTPATLPATVSAPPSAIG